METNHLPTNHGLWMNRNTYESLTPEQEAVLKAAYDALAYMDKYVDKVEEYKKICEDNGMEIIDAENGLDIDGFKAAAENVYDYFAED